MLLLFSSLSLGKIISRFSIIIIEGESNLENKKIDWKYFNDFSLSFKSLNKLISKYVILFGFI